MALPVDLGTVSFYGGNPATLKLVFEDVDYTSKTFRSQIRSAPASTDVLDEWAVTKALVDTDTVVTMYLAGDPAIGNNTGQTRKLIGRSVFDVERIDTATGVPEETMATGTLAISQDVTR